MSNEVVEGDKILIRFKDGTEVVAKCTGVTHKGLIHFKYWDERDTPFAGMIGRSFVQKLNAQEEGEKSYNAWLKSIIKQINEYGKEQETDLVLLRNHLTMLVDDIERSPEFKVQLSKRTD